jgi:hypothetical protein
MALSFIVAGCLSCFSCSADNSKGQKPKNIALNSANFKIVSAYWTSGVQASIPGVSLSWPNDESKGLIVIVQRPTDEQLSFHTNDFVLAFAESAMDVPRRPCYGISDGMKSPTENIIWGGLGPVGRTFVNPGEPYFALIFIEVPKKIKTFTLYMAAPVGPAFTVQEQQKVERKK